MYHSYLFKNLLICRRISELFPCFSVTIYKATITICIEVFWCGYKYLIDLVKFLNSWELYNWVLWEACVKETAKLFSKMTLPFCILQIMSSLLFWRRVISQHRHQHFQSTPEIPTFWEMYILGSDLWLCLIWYYQLEGTKFPEAWPEEFHDEKTLNTNGLST